MEADKVPFVEYRCRLCRKLLCRAFLKKQGCQVEIKCRSCGRLNLFPRLSACDGKTTVEEK